MWIAIVAALLVVGMIGPVCCCVAKYGDDRQADDEAQLDYLYRLRNEQEKKKHEK